MTTNTNASILTAEDEKELDRLIAELPDTKSLPGCAAYEKYKHYLPMALKIIGKIPVYGSKVVAVIQFLMTVADTACAIPAANATTQAQS